ncbi:MAG: iron complex outermembrane receptor protein [Arenicella sp.]|jgi:iron complex outermembrane receptor protein
MNFSFKKIASAVALATIAGPNVSFAQSVLEEIVVTASKRATTLQEIPIAVTVTTADTIEKAQIQDLFDLQSLVPSLRISQLQTSRNANFVIRGFGNGANNPGIEPSVGVFIDGVYRSRSAAAISDLPRLERVEVLSGPQSTLFGKNASAGVVSVVTPVPTGESGGFISGSFGDLGAVVVKALVEGSLSDNVAFDFAGSYNSRDGYFKNLQTGAELNERNRFAVRGQLNWTPSDTTAIRVIADYDQLEESCCGVINLFSGPATLAINALGGQIVPNDPDALEGFYDDPAVNEISNFGLSVQGDFEYEKFSITSITSFRNNDVLDNQDIDFSSADLTNSNKNDINIDTFTQEIRFASNGDGAVDWLVGGFYFDESVEQDTDVLFGPKFRNFIDILLAQAGVPFGLSTVEALSGIPQGSFYQNNSGISSVATLDNKAFSVFGQFDWHATDSLTATLGFNYTDDEKDYSLDSTRTEVRGMFNLGPLNFVPIFPPVTTDTQNPVEDSRTSDDKVTYTARLAWDINDTYNSYISYSTGFKASSINLSRDSAPSPADFATLGSLGLLAANTRAGSRFAQPEEAKVIELGVKARFDRGSLNIAVFDQVLDNFQSNAFVGDAFVLANAERQSVKGAEINFSYSPTDSFSYGVNMTILDPLYDSFTGSAGGDISGEVPSGISELSASFSAQYEFQLGGNEAYVRGDYQYEDKVQVVDGISPDIASREVKLLNVSAGMTTDSGMSYTLWARNLADESFLISAFPSVAQAGSFSGYRNEPRTFGLTVRKDF